MGEITTITITLKICSIVITKILQAIIIKVSISIDQTLKTQEFAKATGKVFYRQTITKWVQMLR